MSNAWKNSFESFVFGSCLRTLAVILVSDLFLKMFVSFRSFGVKRRAFRVACGEKMHVFSSFWRKGVLCAFLLFLAVTRRCFR